MLRFFSLIRYFLVHILSPTLCFRPKFHAHFFVLFGFILTIINNGISTHAFRWIIKIYEYDKCLPFIFFKINNKTIETRNRDKRNKYVFLFCVLVFLLLAFRYVYSNLLRAFGLSSRRFDLWRCPCAKTFFFIFFAVDLN